VDIYFIVFFVVAAALISQEIKELILKYYLQLEKEVEEKLKKKH